VAWSVCVSVGNVGDSCKNGCGMWTRLGPSNNILDVVQIPQGGRDSFGVDKGPAGVDLA